VGKTEFKFPLYIDKIKVRIVYLKPLQVQQNLENEIKNF